jgi:RimJ/RimL family protein N-acetyltransferase
MTTAPPRQLDLDNGTYLRWSTVGDARAIGRAVGESLEYLKPWMPWADAQSADTAFQRTRLRGQPQQRAHREEWQYGLFAATDHAFLGSFGLMTRRGRGTLEIGYWLHIDAGNRGYATTAARALTDTGLKVDGINRMIIVCDEANLRSAAIPQRLGYTLERVDKRTPEAPGETGRMQMWIFDREAVTATP